MLVLERKLYEWIEIDGGSIRIQVVAICGDKVMIGFEAPRGVSIHRQEVADAIRRDEREAALQIEERANQRRTDEREIEERDDLNRRARDERDEHEDHLTHNFGPEDWRETGCVPG